MSLVAARFSFADRLASSISLILCSRASAHSLVRLAPIPCCSVLYWANNKVVSIRERTGRAS